MKKIMSLLLVLSLLLSMACVVTAATSGQLVDGDNEIELPWDTDEASVYTYTATHTGTLYISVTAFNFAMGNYDYEDNMDYMNEWETYTRLTVDGQLLDGLYFGSVEVVEGQTYTFSWAHSEEVVDKNWYKFGWSAVLNLSYSGDYVPELGTEELPVELRMADCPTQSLEIPGGSVLYYLLYDFGGATFTVTGENAYVVVTGFDMESGTTVVTCYEPENGVVSVPVATYYTTIQIGNADAESAVFTLDYYYPLGSEQNPQEMVIGKNVAKTERENWDGYNFTWTADCDGILTLTMPEAAWMASVQNVNVDPWAEWYDPSQGNVITVSVRAGDVVLVNVNSFNGSIVIGGDVTFTASVVYDHKYVDGTCEHCGAAEVLVSQGDVNGDGRINARDARTLLRYLAGLEELSQESLAAADFNADGRVNARDARAILQYLAGLG